MKHLIHITEFVVVSNLENRIIDAGINKAENWWKNRHNHSKSQQISEMTSSPIVEKSGQLIIEILRTQDLHESRSSMLTTTSFKRPYVIIECNKQRFQTTQADSNSTNRNSYWTSGNGPFCFNISNLNMDYLTIWVQQQDRLRVIKGNESKMLGMCEINISQLIHQEQVWLPLRKDNRPAGQILLQIVFIPKEESSR
ncbi:unnamed protein product [Rotaria sp. Silwood2]|nr:unnamed protein product [Rotaria sp. Silwood2]CAF2864123.1 unnamed protein product [Rotaria sp. Silwood2]CAF3096230.1 unnamed protein product [Rotaria sp. Silwood2]CAF3226225.1 unnamed protein product [Rotaria sp. Silwood2]CAF3943977.1 unnamed protein product [Rotaria sp. Silwood2]